MSNRTRPVKSFRAYIKELNEIGEIQEIDREVDWDLEIGGIIKHSYDLGAPAPLFNRIKGIKPGFRVLGAPAGMSRQKGLEFARVALSLGMPPHANGPGIVELLSRTWDRKFIPPEIVTEGPCKENIQTGDDVDLYRFPTPFIHKDDGGRYLNTWGIVIVQTPDKKWTNWSINRAMITGKNTLTGTGFKGQHLGVIFNQWKENNTPMPFAIALGVDPAIPFVGGMPIPDGVSEPDFVGGYLGEPVQVIDCETVPLQVPANSEIVIEGTVHLKEETREGPMGEYTGYISKGESSPQPVYEVSAITHRNAPILPVVAAGEPVEENHTCWGIGISAEVTAELRKHNFPVARCFIPFESAVHWLVVTVNKSARGKVSGKELVQKLAEIFFPSKAGELLSKVLLVDDDIDPGNINEVVWAFASRSHPENGQFLFPNLPPFPLQLFVTPEEKKSRKSTKVIYNCLYPDDFEGNQIPKRLSLENLCGKSLKKKVLTHWHEYGYK
ncbi:MAG: UbiD family decarboxylase [Deltaproteobacteria bacterium]|nr:UbiD family decarboxylase [Deltaproteobacteria bacterium]